MRSETNHTASFRRGAILVFLAVLLMGGAISRAGEKTPPFYSEEDAKAGGPQRNIPTDSKEGRGRTIETPRESRKQGPNEPLPVALEGAFQKEEYVVQKGDWLVKILKKKGLTDGRRNLSDLLSLLRKLNPAVRDLNRIHPGQKIIILVRVGGGPVSEVAVRTTRQQLRYESYTVQPGDTLIRIATERHRLSVGEFREEYLRLFAACNPSVLDPNHLVAGQVIQLPVYPQPVEEGEKDLPVMRDLEKSSSRLALNPKAALRSSQSESSPPPPRRGPSAPPKPGTLEGKPAPDETPPSEQWPAQVKPAISDQGYGPDVSGKSEAVRSSIIVSEGLAAVISGLGDEWIASGEHVIPLRSGGHIQLDAKSYPMVRFREGVTLIVDLNDALPQKMEKVIETTWSNYRVIRLSADDDLHSALDKLLKALNYSSAVRKGKPLSVAGPVPVSISADWILKPPGKGGGDQPAFVAINLMDKGGKGLPSSLKAYLKGIGVDVIEYPTTEPHSGDSTPARETRSASDPEGLITAVLDMRGLPFHTRAHVQAYQTSKADFKLTVLADIYIEMGGGRYVIDLRGLKPEMISLLRENGISVLPLAEEKEAIQMVAKILDFLGVGFERGPHAIVAGTGNPSNHVTLTLTGITFLDRKGTSVLATPLNLPPELVAFLSQKGYDVLVLSPYASPGSGGA